MTTRELPTTTKILRETIERNTRLFNLVSAETLLKTVGTLESLPPAPKTYHALVAAANNPSATLASIAGLVSQDPALSAKVLQLVNTAFFGAKRQTRSVQDALGMLGIEALKGLVLTAHLFEVSSKIRVPAFSYETFQMYSVRVAKLSRMFSTPARADEALTAGILHDIGKLVLAIRVPEKFTEVIARVSKTGEAQHIVERELIGVGHPEAGAYLMVAWGIPVQVVEAVAFHHDPRAVETGDRAIVSVVHAADALSGIIGCGDPESCLDVEFLKQAGFGNEIARWRKLTEDLANAET